MEMQILDVDYVIVDDRPVVRLFGKTMEGEVVCAFHEGYRPYFYAEGDKVRDILEDEPQVQRIERVPRKVAMGYQEPRDVWKVTITNPSRTPELRERLAGAGVTSYEADILFKYRFMNDLGLKGLGWARLEDGNGVSTETVSVGRCIRAEGIEPVQRLEDAPLRTLAFDIECVSAEAGVLPEAHRDPIVLISIVMSEELRGTRRMLLGTRQGPGVTAASSEKEMLERFIEVVQEFDPDIITGYNINNFDFPYLIERMHKAGVRPVMGRCNQKQVNARKIMSRHRVSMIGRVIVDSFELIKKDYSLMRYSLDFVASKLLGESKEPLRVGDIERCWKGGDEDYHKLLRYAQKDSDLAMGLLERLNLIDKYVALSKVSGTLLQDTMGSGEATRIENFLLREFNKAGFVMPCKPSAGGVSRREADKKRELKGGFVLEPEKRLHSNVVVLDFKSMYPTIIRSYNICPTTLVRGDGPEEVVETPGGARFVPKETRMGIVPGILERLMKSRAAAKRKKARAKDPYKRRAFEAEQWALKIMSNAFYGYLGYTRARIYDLGVANAITGSGRHIIQSTKERIEKEHGYRVVYGDTDSVMMKVDTEDLEETRRIASRISKDITEGLPGVMELEFEKVFKRFMPLTKKRYFAWKFEPSEGGWKEGIETKGIETVRRDWCELVGDTLSDVIEIVLKKDDPMEAVSYFTGVVKRLVNNEIPVQKLVITKTMTKSPDSYLGMQPHIELVKKIIARGADEVPGVGDRISYVITKGMGLLSKRAEDPVYIIENGLQVDSKYYIENQLLPPMERIFSVLGVERTTLMGGGRQVDLMCIINGGLEQRPAAEIPRSRMGGFSCERCGRTFPRVPLSGACPCGGGMLFCHPGGTARAVVA